MHASAVMCPGPCEGPQCCAWWTLNSHECGGVHRDGWGEPCHAARGHIRRPWSCHDDARLGSYTMRVGGPRPCDALRGNGPRRFRSPHISFDTDFGDGRLSVM